MASGVRERKKQELRDRLSLTTVLLARERGLANVRVEDVVAQAGVSRRTFSNYFPSKEDAIADRHVRRAQLAAHALRDAPTAGPVWAAITAVILDQYAPGIEPDAGQDVLIALLSDPVLQEAVARGSRAAATEFAQAVAERLGVDVGADVRPRLLANAAVTTPMLVIEFWLRTQSPIPLRSLMRDAFQALGAGFDSPAMATLPAGPEASRTTRRAS